MPFNSPAAILFDIDGTLMDDDRAVLLALVSFHAIYGRKLGISADDLITRWKELLNIHFARYLACEISMQQQRRARVPDLFAASNINLSPETADRVFAAYESAYSASWTAYPDALPTLKALNGYVLAILSNGDLAQQTRKLEVCGRLRILSGSLSRARWDVQSRPRRLSCALASDSTFRHNAACTWGTTWRLTSVAAPPRG